MAQQVAETKTVVMPTYARPEMLALSLQALRNLKRHAELDVRIYLDTAAESRLKEVEFVRDNYFPEALLFHAKPHVQLPSGMWNILNSLKQGYETGAQYVFIVEEDVIVFSDWLDWHLNTHQSGEYMATCGRKQRKYPAYDRYTNPGSCFSRSGLAQVVPHINEDLFNDRMEYYAKHFGVDEELSDLDDGLIRRLAKHRNLQVKYPDSPKCAHIGFHAYNHYDKWLNRGQTIEEKIDILRKMLPTVSYDNRYTGDFEPYEDTSGSVLQGLRSLD